MRILLVADGRSPITKNWIEMLSGLDHELVLVSTYPCAAPIGAELAGVIPAGFSALGGGQVRHAGQTQHSFLRGLVGRFRPLFLKARAVVAPLFLRKHQNRLNELIREIKPDLVHALRIPFEGMLAAAVPQDIHLIVSIWGNDLTLHALSSRGMAKRTRQTLRRTDGLMADAARDITLAVDWGWLENKPSLVVPGSGGLDLAEIKRVISEDEPLPYEIPDGRPLVVNPRGFRPGSVHQDVFFKSIPLVLEKVPDAFFVCTAMRGQPQAENWVRKLGIEDHVLLLPYLDQKELWRLFARADVYVSLSSHDGTPNTFLEALACGCFPVVGDIASLREWLTDGVNGLLVDPKDAQAAAKVIISVLLEGKILQTSKKINYQKFRNIASRKKNIKSVGEMYNKFT